MWRERDWPILVGEKKRIVDIYGRFHGATISQPTL